MGYHFTIDGKEGVEVETPIDPQILLQNKLDEYKENQEDLFEELRGWRSGQLGASDWTQVPDSPLDSTTKTAWATY